jgi:hypothetical protein
LEVWNASCRTVNNFFFHRRTYGNDFKDYAL